MDEREGRIRDERSYIVVVDDDEVDLELLRADIEARYGGAYRILVDSSALEMQKTLLGLDGDHERVAVVLAGQWMGEMNGSELLASLQRRDRRRNVENAQDHAKNKHGVIVTREQALGLAGRD